MSHVKEMHAVLRRADRLYDAESVDTAYKTLAMRIERDYSDRDPVILVVMTGGLMTAAGILGRVRFPFTLDYVHATRYRGSTKGSSLQWKRRPEAVLSGRHVLVIDDILDEGHTLAAIRVALQASDPASLRIAVLAEKEHGRRHPGAEADYVGLKLPDRYVFGCGMDYHDYWRQLPEIWAVKSS